MLNKNKKLFWFSVGSPLKGMLSILLVGLLFLFVLTPQVFSKESHKSHLDNGLTVLIKEIPTSPVVAVYALIKTGSSTEGKYLSTGISHFLEHMLFKGTDTRIVGEIPAEIQAVGGSINAATSRDYTMITISVPADRFDVALDVISDMLINMKIDEVEVEKERLVILKEMKLHRDNPWRRLMEQLYSNAYISHPYKFPIIGYEDLFMKVTTSDLLDYYKFNYVPNNIVLSIAGDIDRDIVLPAISNSFKDFKRTPGIVRNISPEPDQITERYFETQYPTPIARMVMAFSSVSLLESDLYALDVLAVILGQGKSSRLFKDLYADKGLVYSINASNYTPTYRGFFDISASLESDNIAGSISLIWEHINKIKDKGVSKGELDKAKKQVSSSHIYSTQTSSQVAYGQAVDEAFTGDPEFSVRYVEQISEVDRDDIIRVAKKYLIKERLTTVVLKPESTDEELELEDAADQGDIEKIVLDNGLTVLLRENSAFPLMSVRLMLNGGVREEPADLGGLARLTSLTWTKGTKSMTADDIAELSDRAGIHVGGYSGKNSLGLSVEMLTSDIDLGFDLFEDLVKNPTFSEKEVLMAIRDMKTSIRQRKDSISRFTNFELKQVLFPGHPFSLDYNGTLASLSNIARNDIDEYYDRLLVPNNMVITVFGDFKRDEVFGLIDKKFGSLKRSELVLKKYSLGSLDSIVSIERELEKEQAMVMYGFYGVDLKHPDRQGLNVLVSILGSSFNGRLFANVREKEGKAYSVGGNFLPGIDAGYVSLYALTSKENVDVVRELIFREINDIVEKGPTQKELDDTKSYLKGIFKAGMETNSSFGFSSGLDELYGLGFDNYKSYDEKINSVTVEQLRVIALKYLKDNAYCEIITLPKLDD